jgi:2-dehydro-3-deoxyphosphogluconate aldolase/(4S)-4-hydroxy-2-oxoglutarate aldolase
MTDLLALLGDVRIVPVVVIDDAKSAGALGEATKAGGIRVLEVTFRTDAAPAAIDTLSRDPELLIGAGTVINAGQVDAAFAAGAKFVVSPGFKLDIVERAQQLGLPVLPGVANASDILQALAAGIDLVKFFPADVLGGVKALKSYSAPFPALRFVPTGGIGSDNALDYLALGQVAAIGGSWMVPRTAIQNGDFDTITSLVSQAVALVKGT